MSSWMYEKRPIADQGAEEALKRADGKGFVPFGDAKDYTPLTDYDKLLQALYDHAMNDDCRVTFSLAELFDDMGFEDVAHSIREGVRDREKSQGFSEADNAAVRALAPAHERHGAQLIGLDMASEPDTTAYRDPGLEYARKIKLAVVPTKETDNTDYMEWTDADGNVTYSYARLAAIAEHLAKEEG